MTRKTQILCYITIIVVALSLTSVLYMLMPACENCGRKFCFGTCEITYGDSGIPGANILRPSTPKNNQTTTLLSQTERQDDSYLDKITFIGDSRTVALLARGIPENKIFAENGLNHLHALDQKVVQISENKLVTIPDAVRITAPEIMIVNFGINGAAYLGAEEFVEGYSELIDVLLESSPNSIVVVESILPVANYYETKEDGVSNDKIDLLNKALYKMAQDKGLYYMATNESMKDENNKLKSEYSSDGLHYSQAGCQAILDYVLTHAILKS